MLLLLRYITICLLYCSTMCTYTTTTATANWMQVHLLSMEVLAPKRPGCDCKYVVDVHSLVGFHCKVCAQCMEMHKTLQCKSGPAMHISTCSCLQDILITQFDGLPADVPDLPALCKQGHCAG
jgi:hypothetical protein